MRNEPCGANEVRPAGHITTEMEFLNKALDELEGELKELATLLSPVLHSPEPTPDGNEATGNDRPSDCPLANEIATSRRTAERMTNDVRELKRRAEV